MRMGGVEWALLLALSVLWGGSFFFAAVAVAEITPLTLVLGRVAIAAAALLLLMRLRGLALPRERGVWGAFLVMGALNNVIPFTLLFWAQTQIPSGLASILNATTPLWTVLLAHRLTTDERLTAARLARVLVGLAGVAVMLAGPWIGVPGHALAAEVACLVATLSYALANIWGRRFKARGLAPMSTATGQLLASTLLLAPLALAVERPWTLTLPSLEAFAALLALALVSTALAYVIYFRILATAGATNLLLVTLLIPPSAILLGALFLNERLGPQHGIGLAAIGVGLALIDGRPATLLRGQLRRTLAARERR
jgi:drug/metabolite transporter (DMT)-like permease